MENWKNFKNWLETNIIEPEGLIVKLRPEKQLIYPNLTSNALNRFMDSLEATLDGDESCHHFPYYAINKDFETLFNPDVCYFGKKTNKKRIGSASYQDLKKIFLDWQRGTGIIFDLDDDMDKLTIENRVLQERIAVYKKERSELLVQKYSEIDGLEDKIKSLELSLSNKNEEISWLQEQLKKNLGKEKYKNQIEINYPQKFKER